MSRRDKALSDENRVNITPSLHDWDSQSHEQDKRLPLSLSEQRKNVSLKLSDVDYKFETLQIVMDSFKTKMRTDCDAVFQSLDKKAWLTRKELLEYLKESIEDVESRIQKNKKGLMHEHQLAEIDFRKSIKTDAFHLKSDLDCLGRMSHDRMEEVERRLRLTESFYREVKADLNDLIASHDKTSFARQLDDGLSKHTFQQTIYAYRRLKDLNIKVEDLDAGIRKQLSSLRQDTEERTLETQAKVVDLHKILDGILKNEENSARLRDEKMRLIADELKHAYKHHLTSELEQIHSLVRELRVAVDGQGEQGDFLACQFADLARSKDRPVTRAELEALEKRVVELMRPSLDAVTELQYASGLGAGAAGSRLFTDYRRDMDALNEKMREAFLSKHGKQLGDVQVELQAIKLKMERGILEELEIKRAVKESERLLLARIEQLEDEERSHRLRQSEKEEKWNEDVKRARREDEERKKAFDAMVEEWTREKHKMESERQERHERDALARAQQQIEEQEAARQLEITEGNFRRQIQESEAKVQEHARNFEKRLEERLESIEGSVREKDKKWNLAPVAKETKHEPVGERDAEVEDRRQFKEEQQEQMRFEERRLRVETQLRRQITDVSQELKELDKIMEAKKEMQMERVEAAAGAAEKALKRENRELQAERQRLEKTSSRLEKEVSRLRDHLEQVALEYDEKDERHRVHAVERTMQEEKFQQDHFSDLTLLRKQLDALRLQVEEGARDPSTKSQNPLSSNFPASTLDVTNKLDMLSARLSRIEKQSLAPDDIKMIDEIVEAKISRRKLGVIIGEKVREEMGRQKVEKTEMEQVSVDRREALNKDLLQEYLDGLDRVKDKCATLNRKWDQFEGKDFMTVLERLASVEKFTGVYHNRPDELIKQLEKKVESGLDDVKTTSFKQLASIQEMVNGDYIQSSIKAEMKEQLREQQKLFEAQQSQLKDLQYRTTQLDVALVTTTSTATSRADVVLSKVDELASKVAFLSGDVRDVRLMKEADGVLASTIGALDTRLLRIENTLNASSQYQGLQRDEVVNSRQAKEKDNQRTPSSEFSTTKNFQEAVVTIKSQHRTDGRDINLSNASALTSSVSAPKATTAPVSLASATTAATSSKSSNLVHSSTTSNSSAATKPSRGESEDEAARQSGANKHKPVISLREQHVSTLAGGHTFMRYPCGKGKPARKTLYYVASESALYWCDVSAKRNPSSDKSVLLDEVTDIFVGKGTPAFENTAGQGADETCCFSISAARGSLDLEADTPEVRAQWVTALEGLAPQAQVYASEAAGKKATVPPVPVVAVTEAGVRAPTLGGTALEEMKPQGVDTAHIFVSCKSLWSKDNQRPDVFVALFEYDPEIKGLKYGGQTEWQQAVSDPSFQNGIEVSLEGEIHSRQMRLKVLNIAHPDGDVNDKEDCLGWVDINFSDLVSSPDQSLAYRLINLSDAAQNQHLEDTEATIFLILSYGSGGQGDDQSVHESASQAGSGHRQESPSLSRNKKKAKPSNNKKSSLMTDLGLSDDGSDDSLSRAESPSWVSD